ncbi:hypothetical protein [Nocardia farcinica]|uniref:hypothetical protein n=1 Tax=Nocardia farcinica TaxID=37329 RepID=UPI002458C773|nr:hypothetical protein [Nocardia farcinica]
MSALNEGAVYRNNTTAEGEEYRVTLIRRIRNHGGWTLGPLQHLPAPVIGEIWLARLHCEGLEQYPDPEILVTPEGLTARGFTPIAEEAGL